MLFRFKFSQMKRLHLTNILHLFLNRLGNKAAFLGFLNANKECLVTNNHQIIHICNNIKLSYLFINLHIKC